MKSGNELTAYGTALTRRIGNTNTDLELDPRDWTAIGRRSGAFLHHQQHALERSNEKDETYAFALFGRVLDGITGYH